MRWWGRLIVVLRTGESLPHVPNHLDCLLGASRPVSRLDGGSLDGVINRWGSGFRARCVFHAQRSLGRPGEQHVGFNDLEEGLGLSRTYKIEIGEAERTADVLSALRDLDAVEQSAVETLATIPFAAAPNRLAQAWTRADSAEPHRRVMAPQALRMEPGDERVSVGIVDTGVALGHPEFQRKLLAGYDTCNLGLGRVHREIRLVGDSRGADFSPRDECGHGSHVAGVIGAQGWRLEEGVAGRCMLLPIRVLAAALADKGGRTKRMGVGGLADIDAGLKVAVDLGADVLNMSFGTAAGTIDPSGPQPHGQVIKYASEQGCVLVAAAGNSGLQERFYPAALPEVIAVGSVDAEGKRSSFSTYGDHLALCAPGEGILSVGRRGYLVSSGTSHAAPFVSGAAALLVSRARRTGRDLTGAEVKRLLIESAIPLSSGYSAETGHGLLDMATALRRLDESLAAAPATSKTERRARSVN